MPNLLRIVTKQKETFCLLKKKIVSQPYEQTHETGTYEVEMPEMIPEIPTPKKAFLESIHLIVWQSNF